MEELVRVLSEGRMLSLWTCPACGAAVIVRPSDDPVQRHIAWHLKGDGGA